MTAELPNILTGPNAQRIGWTLLHFLWQGALVGLLLATLLQYMQRTSAQARYLAACCALAILAILPPLTAALIEIPTPPQTTSTSALSPAPPRAPSASAQISTRPPANPSAATEPPSVPMTNDPLPVTRPLASLLPWAVLVWTLGVAAMSLYQIAGYLLVHRIRRLATPLTDVPILETFHRLRIRLAIKPPVKLLQSALGASIKTPIALGILRPAILLPASLLTTLSPSQLEAILAHELAHIRRHDCLIKIIQAALETLLFFHPAVWWISSRITQESENCCDEQALKICSNPHHYAQALAIVAGAYDPTLTPAATGGKLLPRLRRILALPEARSTPRTLLSASLALALLAAIIAVPLACSSAGSNKSAQTRASAHLAAPQPATAPEAAPLARVHIQMRAVDQIRSNGKGRVTWTNGAPEGPFVSSYDAANNGTDASLAPLKDLKQLRDLNLDRTKVTDAGLVFLEGLRDLRGLRLEYTPVTDAGMKHLKGLDKLQSLYLDSTDVSDTGLEQLKGLQKLRALSLETTRITDAGLAHLQTLTNLDTLNLDDTQISDAGLTHLKGLKQLQILYLNRTKVTDAGVKKIQQALPSCYVAWAGNSAEQPSGNRSATQPATAPATAPPITQKQVLAEIKKLGGQVGVDVDGQVTGISFRVNKKKLTDDGLKYLHGLNHLKLLDLTGTNVSDIGMEYLKELKTIQVLFLGETRVTDAGLKYLTGMSGLEYLVLEDTRVTDKGLESIKDMKHIETLNLGGTKITDVTMKLLAGFSDLQNVNVDGTRVTDSGLTHLKALKGLIRLSLRVTKVTDAGLEHLQSLNHLEAIDLTGTKVSNEGLAKLRKALPNCAIDH